MSLTRNRHLAGKCVPSQANPAHHTPISAKGPCRRVPRGDWSKRYTPAEPLAPLARVERSHGRRWSNRQLIAPIGIQGHFQIPSPPASNLCQPAPKANVGTDGCGLAGNGVVARSTFPQVNPTNDSAMRIKSNLRKEDWLAMFLATVQP